MYPWFMRLNWWFNDVHLYLIPAALRWLVFRALVIWNDWHHQKVAVKFYDLLHPQAVGYRGWIESPRFGVLAFVKDDGSLQFMW